jgi:hypothetical protein
MFDHVHGQIASQEQFSKNSPSIVQLMGFPSPMVDRGLFYHVNSSRAGCTPRRRRSLRQARPPRNGAVGLAEGVPHEAAAHDAKRHDEHQQGLDRR